MEEVAMEEAMEEFVSIWKICCWVETIILFGTGFAEGILILLYSDYLFFEVSVWYLLLLCICAVVDISGHLAFLFIIIMCCNKNRVLPKTSEPVFYPARSKKRNVEEKLDKENRNSIKPQFKESGMELETEIGVPPYCLSGESIQEEKLELAQKPLKDRGSI
jgi:hypothetical protein